MCGRLSVTTPTATIAEFFLAMNFADASPSFNIPPTTILPIVCDDPHRQKRCLYNARWGLIPAWAKDSNIGNKLSNARCETLTEKPAFRNSIKYYRCIIPVDGFYEWKRKGKTKETYYFQLKEGKIMPMAGLFALWNGPNGEQWMTFTIITTDANPLMAPIHHRMPVLLRQEQFDLWLNPGVQHPKEILHMLKPYPHQDLELWQVSNYVNSTANQGPDCNKHFTPEPEPQSPDQLSLF